MNEADKQQENNVPGTMYQLLAEYEPQSLRPTRTFTGELVCYIQNRIPTSIADTVLDYKVDCRSS